MVGNSNEIHIVFPNTIDDTVRKPWNDPLAKAALQRRACLWAGENALLGLLDRGEKAEPQSIKALLIELH